MERTLAFGVKKTLVPSQRDDLDHVLQIKYLKTGLTSHIGAGLPGGCGAGRGQPQVPQVNRASSAGQGREGVGQNLGVQRGGVLAGLSVGSCLAKMSSAEECAVRGILQNLPSAACSPPPPQGGVCLCVYFYCACLCRFERGQDLWMPDLGQLVEAPGCSLFLGFCPDL